MRDFRQEKIDRLIEDYAEYLSDFDLAELRLIEKSNVFTLREAKRTRENNG